MLTLKPRRVLTGVYRFRAQNNSYPAVHLFHPGGEIFRLDGAYNPISVGTMAAGADTGFGKVSFHPEEERVVFALKEGGIAAGDFRGNILWQQEGPFSTTWITRDGELVWAASNLNNEQILVCLFDLETGGLLASLELADPLYASSLYLSDIPGSNRVLLDFAAGQDGLAVYRLDWEQGAIQTSELFPKTSFSVPAWKPDGSRLLTIENDEEILGHFSWPGPEPLAREVPPDYDSIGEEEWENAFPGYHHIYLSSGKAIVQSRANRYYLFDPERMERREELAFPGFEPRSTCELYPTLKGDTALYSLVDSIERVGNLIIAQTEGRERPVETFVFEESDLLL